MIATIYSAFVARIKSEIVASSSIRMTTLPENVQYLLKAGIFHFGSEDLSTFLHTSTLIGYNWIGDDSEPDKRERVLEAINSLLQISPFHSFHTVARFLQNLLWLEIRRESLPPSIRDSLSRLFSTVSATEVENIRYQYV
jgi:hypothetical protein